jgi:hypothetical protein
VGELVAWSEDTWPEGGACGRASPVCLGQMPQPITEYKCLLMSPGDVVAERDALTNMAQLWNAQMGKMLDVRIDLVRWESHGTPDMSQPAQAVLNEQFLEDCELAIAVFLDASGDGNTGLRIRLS